MQLQALTLLAATLGALRAAAHFHHDSDDFLDLQAREEDLEAALLWERDLSDDLYARDAFGPDWDLLDLDLQRRSDLLDEVFSGRGLQRRDWVKTFKCYCSTPPVVVKKTQTERVTPDQVRCPRCGLPMSHESSGRSILSSGGNGGGSGGSGGRSGGQSSRSGGRSGGQGGGSGGRRG